MNNPQIKYQGVRFGKGQPTRLGGRPKKTQTILKEKGYSKDDMVHTVLSIAWSTNKEIEELVNNEEMPVIVRIVGKSFLKAFKHSSYKPIKDIMEQVLGKPSQSIETKDKVAKPVPRIVFWNE